MKQWRILHSEASEGWGGQEIRVLAELEWMRGQGHWVALLAPRDSEIARNTLAAGIPVVFMSNSKPLMPLSIIKVALWMFWNRVSIVCTHSSVDGWIAGIAARLAWVRLIVRYRHVEVDYPKLFTSRLAFAVIPHFVITTSQKIADRLEKEVHVKKKRLFCVSTGVDLNRFNPEIVGSLHQELSLPSSTRIIGMISVLRSWKGHAVLLKAWKILLEKYPAEGQPVHLVIAGGGPGRDELAKQCERHPFSSTISLLGHRTDVPNILASLTALVLPSTAHEGIPQIVLQAQAMGRAVVASNIGGIPEVIQDWKTGMLFAPGNASDLAAKLQVLLETPNIPVDLGAMARHEIVKSHSIDAMGERISDLFREHLR